MGSQLLEQPLLSPSDADAGSGISVGPRILDRDGDFSQSRGRWRVSNIHSRSRGSVAGSIRQRHSAGSTINNSSSLAATRATRALSRRPRRLPSRTFWDRLCCREADNQLRLTPRRCWDDWFRKSILTFVL